MADIDYFKKFNDLYGHEAGDVLIIKLAELFMRNIRGSDIACRYGGEEFLFILPETSGDDTIKRAEALRQEAKNLNVFCQKQLLCHITISMGVAVYPDNAAEVKDLLSVADKALYKAKKAQGRVVSADSL
jgi:diguanylate cyclase (GGDEF)-like protein